jgi:hypothetical protein
MIAMTTCHTVCRHKSDNNIPSGPVLWGQWLMDPQWEVSYSCMFNVVLCWTSPCAKNGAVLCQLAMGHGKHVREETGLGFMRGMCMNREQWRPECDVQRGMLVRSLINSFISRFKQELSSQFANPR